MFHAAMAAAVPCGMPCHGAPCILLHPLRSASPPIHELFLHCQKFLAVVLPLVANVSFFPQKYFLIRGKLISKSSSEQIGAVRQLPRAQLTSSMDGPHWHAQLVPQSRWCGMTGLDSGQLRSFYTLRARARALRHRQPAVQLCAPERPKSCHSTPLACAIAPSARRAVTL